METPLYLIQLVAWLVNDSKYIDYSQTEIAAALETYRIHADRVEAVGVGFHTQAGVKYHTYQTGLDWRFLDTGAILQDRLLEIIAPDSIDYRNGIFSFTADNLQTETMLYVTGESYDVYASAHDLMIAKSGRLAEDLQSFSTQNGSFTFASKADGVKDAALRYWNMSRQARMAVPMQRGDLVAA
jgi:hypothetical protein